MRGEGDATVETKVWDLPTRLFHWALALTLVGSFLTVRAHDMRLHALCGYTALTLVLFRILWGLFGSESARFASFLRGPGAVFAHVRALLGRRPDHETTHNALGGWAVMLMLGLVLAQGATGLVGHIAHRIGSLQNTPPRLLVDIGLAIQGTRNGADGQIEALRQLSDASHVFRTFPTAPIVNKNVYEIQLTAETCQM